MFGGLALRTGAYLLVVKRDQLEVGLEIWKRRVTPPLQYRLVKTYPISVGTVGFQTDPGVYWVQSRAKNPDWYVPDSDWAGELRGTVIRGGDPRNPIKGAWLGLMDSVGIHGTADFLSLGKRASHGCIRVHPTVATDLYERVRKGTPVVIL